MMALLVDWRQSDQRRCEHDDGDEFDGCARGKRCRAACISGTPHGIGVSVRGCMPADGVEFDRQRVLRE